MNDCLDQPKTGKMNWPVTEKMTVSVGKRGRFLGAGGSNLKKILTDTGVQISQNPDDASEYTLFAPNSEAMSEAKEMIKNSLKESRIPEFEFGATYEVMITEILDRGVFVQLHPDLKPAFIPNNQLDARKVIKCKQIAATRILNKINFQISNAFHLGFREGQKIMVRYYGADPATGAMRLSRKTLTVGAASAVNKFKAATNPETSR